MFNLPVTVENFEYWLDQAGDIGYTIDFKEYRFANGSAATLDKPKDAAGEKTQTAAQLNASTGSSDGGTFTKRYTKSDATVIAKIMYGEARGIKSKTEIACIAWCILNRVDAGMGKSIEAVATAKSQFYYKAGAPTVSDHGYDLVALATDVLDRWSREKAGQTNVGRVLPKQYKWYAGDGSHNWFYPSWPCKRAQRWNFKSVSSPYPN